MRIFAKAFKWALGVTVVAVGLMLLAPLLVSSLVNTDAVRAELSARVKAEIQADLTFGAADVALLPRPHLIIRQAKLLKSGKYELNAAAAKFYPRPWPLFQGRFEPAKVRLESPEYLISLPAATPPSDASDASGRLNTVDLLNTRTHNLMQGLTALSLPDVELQVRNGRVRLKGRSEGRPGFDLRHIHGRYAYHHQRIDFSYDCMSNLFKQIAIRGWVNPETFEGVARIELSEFQPESVVDYLFPGAALQMSEAHVSATIDIDSEGAEGIQARIAGSAPRLNVSRGESSVVFRDQTWRGELLLQGGRLTVRLADLTSAAPRMNVSGSLEIDDRSRRARLNVSGAEVDVAEVRAAALLLLGDDETVADIFDVLRAGRVPAVHVAAEGGTLKDLQRLENYRIDGDMLAGRLHIPGLDFDLRDVSGNALIAEGILNGSSLAARMGDSTGSDGDMALSLKGSRAFRLGIDVKADLAELPPVLIRLLENPGVVAELEGLDQVEGSAAGRLTIDQKKAATSVTVDASAVKLACRYTRIPYPVSISRARLKLRNDGMTIAQMTAALGGTSLTGLSGEIVWQGGALRLNLQAEGLDLDNAEMAAWLPSLATDGPVPQAAEIGGRLTLGNLKLSFNQQAAGSAELDVGGNISRGVISSPRLPAPLVLESGGFSRQPRRLRLTDLSAALGRSNLKGLTASIGTDAGGEIQASCAQAVIALEEFLPWLARATGSDGLLGDLSAVAGMVQLTNANISGTLNSPAAWQWDTSARLQAIRLQSKTLGAPLAIPEADLTAAREGHGLQAGSRFTLQPAEVLWGDSSLRLAGDISLSRRLLRLNLQVAADQLRWPQIAHLVDRSPQRETPADTFAILGDIAVSTDSFHFGALTWQPVITRLTLKPRQVNLAVERADLCGITFGGRIDFSDGRIDLKLVPQAAGQMLDSTVSCLTEDKNMVTGRFDLTGRLAADAAAADLRRSIDGDVSLTANGGRIHRFGLLAKIFSILNVTEIYRGQMPDLTGEGFPYESMTIAADVEQSRIIFKQCAVEAQSMGLACEGEIDLAAGQMDVVVLVAPFRTADRIVKHIPVVGGILGGNLISIPFRATGGLEDPTVIPLSPTAVGAGVLGILERTLKLPITLMQPLFSKPESEEPSRSTQEQKQ